MSTRSIARQFEAVGARARVVVAPLRDRFTVDVVRDDEGELFEVRLAERSVDLQVVNARPDVRHLLLLGDLSRAKADWQRLLCGHDERHWFAAAVPRGNTVEEAWEALKPAAVRVEERRRRVRTRDRNRRRNAAFVRQGEWFFVPAPELAVAPDDWRVLRREPLRRGNGKPHVAELAFRVGGLVVYVSRRYPRGLTEVAYRRLLTRRPELRNAGWRVMRRDPEVYVRGRVRHPDHKTIVLPGWHRVHLSGEVVSRSVVFLD